MPGTIDELNFKVILDDKDFNDRIQKDIKAAKDLNVQLSQLLQAKVKINTITAQEAASAKRASDIAAKQAIDQERIRKAAELAAAAEEKKRTQAEKTNNEIRKGATESAKAAKEQQRTATEAQRTAAAANQAAVNAQRFRTEQQRTATEAQRTATATQNTARATANAQLAQKRLADYSKQTTRQFQTQSRLLNELKGYALGYLSIHGASQLLSSLVRVTGEFELQKTTLAAMLGDLNAAEGIITRIQGLAVESPFQFKELTTYAKQLSAFSVPAQELYDTTKMLADVSAGLGVGMDRIVLAYGQVRSAAFLRGQEVRQFTEAGIPILDELAKQFSELEGRAVSTGEVFDKISARLVPFEMVAKVFKDMTSEGGKFYNMQEVQAETLRGKISNLKDAYEVMLNEIGSAHSDKLKGAIDGVRNLMQNWEKIGGQLVDLIKLFGAYKVAVGLLSISDTIAKFGGLAKAIQSTAAAQRLMNSALMTNPYIAVATAITAVAIAVSRHRKELGSTTAAQNEYNRRVKELERIDRERSSAIRNLIDTVQDETQATVEREAALMSLKDAYPEIFAQYDIESLKLADILKIKKQISEEDAKRRKVEAYGSLGAQEGRIKALIARGASDNHIESATAVLREMQKGYLEKYVLPDMVSGLRDMTDDALNKALQEAYRKSQYNTRGIEEFEGIPTTQDFYEDLYAAIQAEIKRRNSTKLVDGWRKKVQDTLSNLGLDEGTAFGLWAKDTTQSTEYVDALIKRYKELGEQIKNVSSFDKEQTERLQKNKDAIEAVAKALNIDIKALTAPKGGNKKSQAQIDIEEQIKSVQKLQDAYEKLMPYLNEVQMKSTLKAIFPNIDQGVIDSLDFDAELTRLADRLEEFDEDAAQRLRDTIGKDVAGTIAESFKAVEQYKKMLDSWLGEDFSLSGEGVSFDISKVIRNLNNEYSKIDQKREKALDMLNKAQMGDELALAKVREVYGEEVWQKYLENGERVINELALKEKNAAKQTADENIRDLANKYVSEQLKAKNVNLSEFEDKTLAQIKEQIKRLEEIRNEAQNKANEALVAAVTGKLESGEYAQWQMLLDVLKQLDILIDDTGEEVDKKVTKNIQKSLSAVSDLGNKISSLGSDLELPGMEQLGRFIGETAQGAASIMEALESDNPVELVTNIVSMVYSGIATMVTAAYERQKALNEASAEYADILRDIRRESYSGIFGTDEMGLAAENAKILKEAQDDYQDVFNKFTKEVQGRGGWSFKKVTLADMLGGISKEDGWDLYLENGELNIKALEAYYDAYSSRLTKKQRDLVQNLIESGNAVDDAAAQQTEYLTSLFSEVADNIAEGMIDAFLESGDAAMDMGNVISDVSKQMVADLIKSVYLMPILESYRKQFDAIGANTALEPTERTEQQLALLETALAQISGQSDNITATIERFEEYLRAGEGKEGTTDLGQGIKGITEDQANLLASYLNAIRADVSYSKTLWQRMDANLQRLADMLVSSPTLMEYQAQIAANTYNTAQATQQILAELRSVVTTDSGDSAIRVYS